MKALIFDMDGVLVDVNQSYRMAIKKTAEYFIGEEISKDEIQKLKNQGGFNDDVDLTEALISMRGLMFDRNKLLRKFNENYGQLKDQERWLLDLETLRKMYLRYKMGIVTGRPRKDAEYALKKANAEKFFEVVIAMEDVPKNKRKPDAYGLNLAIARLGATKVYYFGDNIDDMKMAVGAGAVPIGVLPPGIGGNLKGLLMENGAKTVLEDINNLKSVID